MLKFFLFIYAQYLRIKTLYAYKGNTWRYLEIEECGEELVEVPSSMTLPFYANEMKLIEDTRIFVRREVYKRFLKARSKLAKYSIDLILYDGWRSITLQENLFWHYLKKFTVVKFNLQDAFASAIKPEEIKEVFESLPVHMQDILREANRTYVSWPSSDPASPSPHSTGGSIDVWLYQNGKRLNLGIPFDWMEENAGAFYHLKKFRKKFSGNDGMVCYHRNLLLYAMASVGFSCYGPEIWHFNYGNQMDSLVSKKIAKYSYIEP